MSRAQVSSSSHELSSSDLIRLLDILPAMKIAFLAPASSIHTRQWVEGMAARGHDVMLMSAHPPDEAYSSKVDLRLLRTQPLWAYFNGGRQVRQWSAEFKADIFHVHYASGYGTLARRAGLQPSVLSVWGSDIFEFPHRSAWHRRLLQANLNAATGLAATSQIMARATRKLCSQEVWVTPFGVHLEAFKARAERASSQLCFGTIKSLLPQYGIDRFIRAFALARLQGLPSQSEALIVGSGPLEQALKDLVSSLRLEPYIRFVPRVPHAEVPAYLGQMDVFVALSRQESFGVAVIEASAAERPVIVSDVGGLPEVVQDRHTGLVIADGNIELAAQAMLKLAAEPDLRAEYGRAGRAFVGQHFSWDACLKRMEELYRECLV